jgi:hypothetical protein
MPSDLLREMRGWCADVFSDYPDDATDAEVIDCVRHQYDGGLEGFRRDAE